jgi:hypothetical protein
MTFNTSIPGAACVVAVSAGAVAGALAAFRSPVAAWVVTGRPLSGEEQPAVIQTINVPSRPMIAVLAWLLMMIFSN